MKRKSTGKRLRFSIFERDNFTCQYCGKKPPEVILNADHIVPVSKGGGDEPENLLTSCRDCNFGKSDLKIGNFPVRALKNKDEFQEKYEQLKAFYEYQKKFSNLQESVLNDIKDYWEIVWDGDTLTQKGLASLRYFIKTFSPSEIKEAIDISRKQMKDGYVGFSYMCGVLMNWKRDKEKL